MVYLAFQGFVARLCRIQKYIFVVSSYWMNWKWFAGTATIGLLLAGMWLSKHSQGHAAAPALLVTTQDNRITFMPSERYTSTCVMITKTVKPAGN